MKAVAVAAELVVDHPGQVAEGWVLTCQAAQAGVNGTLV